MIPKIIHYAWFGSEVPFEVKNRINQWKAALPEWKFMFWNEKNFNVDKFSFTKEMLSAGNLGYASDELRYYVLNKFGGFYLDTDMVIKKDLSSFLNQKMVWGFQYKNSVLTSFIGSEANEPLLKKILDVYAERDYIELSDDKYHMTSNPFITKIFLKEFNNFRLDGSKQILSNGVIIYPLDYFTYPSRNKKANYTEHLFDNSWGSSNKGIRGTVKRIFKKYLPYVWAKLSAKRGIKSSEKDGIPSK